MKIYIFKTKEYHKSYMWYSEKSQVVAEVYEDGKEKVSYTRGDNALHSKVVNNMG